MEWYRLGKLRQYFFIILLFLTNILISCKSTKIVEIPVDRVKVEYKDRLQVDTIIKNDSIIIKNKGDTIYIEKYKYVYRIKERKDTISIRDTITVVKQVEVIKEKEINKLMWWQKLLIGIGGIAIIFYLFKYIIKKWI